MRIALISDVHGNLPALEAVLKYLKTKSPDEIWFLGDAIGYGPWPCECVDLLRQETQLFMAGNHEYLVTGKHDRSIYTQDGTQTLDWTISQLEGSLAFLEQLRPSLDLTWENSFRVSRTIQSHYGLLTHSLLLYLKWRKYGKLDFRVFKCQPPSTYEPVVIQLAHASVLEPVNEYLIPGQVSVERLLQNFVFMKCGVAFFGHTHRASHIWVEQDGEVHQELLKLGEPVVFNPQNDAKRLLNPGSVGQPRDGDSRASFALLDITGDPSSPESKWVFTIGRKPYDIDSVVARFKEFGLPDGDGMRLYKAQ